MRRADPDVGDSGRKLIILLDQASLESVKGAGGKEYQLLNPDKHKDRILKSNRDVSTVRPDITHQCLLMLLDSPLNRMGMLQVNSSMSGFSHYLSPALLHTVCS